MNYKKIYDRLITKSLSRLTKPTPSELHHIIPKCIEGTDYADNLVHLSPREHFLAHKLLSKIYIENNKLLFAVEMMSVSSKNTLGRDFKLSSKEYEKLSIAKSKFMSENNPMKNEYIAKKVLEKRMETVKKRGPIKMNLSGEERLRRQIHMRERNPMSNPAISKKAMESRSARIKAGDLVYRQSDYVKGLASKRLLVSNPMKNPDIAKKASDTFKRRRENGELVLLNGKWRRPVP